MPIYRLLENKLDNEATHVSSENLIETLKNMNVANVSDPYYTALYKGSLILQVLESVFQLKIDRKNYKPSESKSLSKIIIIHRKQSVFSSIFDLKKNF